jgi:hypothetical protein
MEVPLSNPDLLSSCQFSTIRPRSMIFIWCERRMRSSSLLLVLLFNFLVVTGCSPLLRDEPKGALFSLEDGEIYAVQEEKGIPGFSDRKSAPRARYQYTEDHSPQSETSLAEKQFAQRERILNLIESIDDADIKRILAEKLPNTGPGADSPPANTIGSTSPELMNSPAELNPMFDTETPRGEIDLAAYELDSDVTSVPHSELLQPDNEVSNGNPDTMNSSFALDSAISRSRKPASSQASFLQNSSFAKHPSDKLDEPMKERNLVQQIATMPASVQQKSRPPASLQTGDKPANQAGLETSVESPEHSKLLNNTIGSESKDWKADLQATIASLESSLNDSEPAATDQATLQIYLRLLHLINNNRNQATAQIPVLDEQNQAFWISQMQALNAMLSDQEADRSGSLALSSKTTDQAVTHLQQAVAQLSQAADLKVKNLAFCREVMGYGQFVTFNSDQFSGNQPVLVYCELENFVNQTRQIDGKTHYETEFRGRVFISDEQRQVVYQHEYGAVRDSGQQRRRDFYMHFPLRMPTLKAGKYTLHLEIEDLNGNKVGTSDCPLSLTIR